MFPSLDSPPRYDAHHTDWRTSSTSLKPYLQLPHILSLTWLAYPVISLLFVIFRLQLSSAEAQSAVASAKDDLLAACQAAEQAATSAASMPRYLAIAVNQQFADAVNGTMNGAREALILALTCMEAIINFLISIYRSTFLCFLELVVVGGLDLLISAVQEITSFLQSTLNSIVSSLKNDANSLNSAIQSAVNSINSINPFGNIQAPQFNVSSLDAISNITIPTDFENALIQLNSSLPSVSSIKNTIADLADTPFETVKADINNTLLGLTFDPTLLPVPAQSTVSFCNDLDTSSVDNLGNDLLQITKIGTIILIAVLFLLLAGHCIFEWYKWRCLMRHLRFTREAWMSDPSTCQITSSGTPTVILTDHNLLMLQIDAQHPLLTRIAFMLTAWLRLTPSQHTHLRWLLHYIFHPPALACFLIGFFGLLSVQIQLIAIGPLEAQYSAQVTASVQDLSNTIATQLNNTMYNQSATYANGINVQVETVQSTINNGLFGWVNGTTTTLNDTLNSFYADIQGFIGTIFNGTILETPAQDFIKCLIGSKVDAIEEALTFLNQNLNVDLPQVNETVLVLSPANVNEITQPIATAAVGGSSSNSQGLIGSLVATYVSSLEQERLMFAIFMGLWGVVVLMGLAIVFWHSYAKNWVDAYQKRKWQKEQQSGLEGFVIPPKEVPRVGDAEKGQSMQDPPLRSFTPLPEVRSPFSISPLCWPDQSPSRHPLRSLEPAFEKSWNSFFREATNNKQPEAAEPHCTASHPMKLMNFSKRRDDEGVSETSGEARPEDRSKSGWFRPVIRLLSKKENVQPVSEFVVSRPTSGSAPCPQLAISAEETTAGDFPKIDTITPMLEEQPSPVSPVPPVLPWMKSGIPPKKAIPLTIPPPPPGRLQSTNVLTGAERVAIPLHYAFEERPASQKPIHIAAHTAVLPSQSDPVPPQERKKQSSTIPISVSPSFVGPISRHQSTRSTSRLLTNMHVQSPGELVDPFATPFDDDARIISSAKPKKFSNPFADFDL